MEGFILPQLDSGTFYYKGQGEKGRRRHGARYTTLVTTTTKCNNVCRGFGGHGKTRGPADLRHSKGGGGHRQFLHRGWYHALAILKTAWACCVRNIIHPTTGSTEAQTLNFNNTSIPLLRRAFIRCLWCGRQPTQSPSLSAVQQNRLGLPTP